MNKSEISFSKAIKLVHPDINPNIKNASEKVKTIMLYKNNPIKLYKCLANWGLVKAETPPKLKRVFLNSLKPNTLYDGTVWVTHKKGLFKVKRTTNKRVYFDDAYTNGKMLKFCHIKSVINAFKVYETKS